VKSPIALRALRLELRGEADSTSLECLLGDRLNAYYGRTNTGLRIGIIDIDGGETIAAGTTAFLRLTGEYEIVSHPWSMLN